MDQQQTVCAEDLNLKIYMFGGGSLCLNSFTNSSDHLFRSVRSCRHNYSSVSIWHIFGSCFSLQFQPGENPVCILCSKSMISRDDPINLKKKKTKQTKSHHSQPEPKQQRRPTLGSLKSSYANASSTPTGPATYHQKHMLMSHCYVFLHIE